MLSKRVSDPDVQTFRLGFFAKRIIVDTLPSLDKHQRQAMIFYTSMVP